MPELPQELLEEILCRVPATFLIRLRSTCKEWKRLFNDTRFSKKHYDKAAKQSLDLIPTEKFRVCSLSLNLHGTPSVEVACELSLIDSYSNSNQVNINKVVHCDGFLLCNINQDTRIVVWNPCTAQTIWIQTGENRCYENEFVLGYYQDNKSYDKSYKILSYRKYNFDDRKFEIYDINSDSWTNLNVTLDCKLYTRYHVSLKGKTYWFAKDEKEEHVVTFLLSFDYTRERFERLRLPYQCNSYENVSLSVVGEEKLLVLLQHRYTSRREIWTTNKFDDETKEIMWSKLLEVEIVPRRHLFVGISFYVDEEKKVVVFFEKEHCIPQSVTEVSIVGEDNKAIQVDFQVKTIPSCWPFLVNYVPHLIQI